MAKAYGRDASMASTPLLIVCPAQAASIQQIHTGESACFTPAAKPHLKLPGCLFAWADPHLVHVVGICYPIRAELVSEEKPPRDNAMHQNGNSLTHPGALVSSNHFANDQQPSPRSLLPRSSRRRQAIIWGIGSTVLSALGLIALCLFEQYNGMLSELRADLKHFNETVGEYAKKDKVSSLREAVRQCSAEMTASRLQREQLEQELKVSQTQRGLLEKELQQLRERLAYVEGMRAAVLGTSAAKGSLPDKRNSPTDELHASGR
jgi:hypothetical protein